jgi:protein tyrosine phosphatase (PTP) superfamily phosphohydrolase (DUF442 family)
MEVTQMKSMRNMVLVVALVGLALGDTGCGGGRPVPIPAPVPGSDGGGLGGQRVLDLRPRSLLATNPGIDKAFNITLNTFRWMKTALPKFDQVTPALFRGGQPRPADGLQELARRGIRTVINLRLEDNGEAPKVRAAGMRAVYIPIPDTAAPTAAQVKQFRAVLADAGALPAYVHCASGTFRTGTMCAIALIDAGASADQAMADMRRHGWTPKMGDAWQEEVLVRDYAARPQVYR